MRNDLRRGAVMLEMALLLPLLVMLLLGAIHFGYLFYLYDGLEKSVRDGARYAASRSYYTDDAKQAGSAGVRTFTNSIKNVVVCGSPSDDTADCSGAFSKLTVSGLTRPMVVVEPIWSATAGRPPERVRVRIVGYNYQGVLSWMFGTTTLNKPGMEILYFGRYAPPPK